MTVAIVDVLTILDPHSPMQIAVYTDEKDIRELLDKFSHSPSDELIEAVVIWPKPSPVEQPYLPASFSLF